MKRLLVLAATLALAVPGRADVPASVAQALERMPFELPRDLGYTMDVERDGVRSTERYDPSRPAGSRWTLVKRDGRTPSEQELTEYLRQLSVGRDPGYRASFRPDQVDLPGAELIRESSSHLTVRLRFTEAATGADKMLGQLDLTLLVRKATPTIASYRLHLRQPYSPVLGVKMHALDAGAELDETGRPIRTWSRFEGRIFLRKADERVETKYGEYVTVLPETPAP